MPCRFNNNIFCTDSLIQQTSINLRGRVKNQPVYTSTLWSRPWAFQVQHTKSARLQQAATFHNQPTNQPANQPTNRTNPPFLGAPILGLPALTISFPRLTSALEDSPRVMLVVNSDPSWAHFSFFAVIRCTVLPKGVVVRCVFGEPK